MIRKQMPKRLIILIASIALLICSAWFYSGIITRFPSHVHAWSQADRLALAYGFIDNSFDFFHPATNNLRPEYEASKELTEEKGITQVDFPVIEYIAAVLMKLTGVREPVLFRLLVLIISLLGIISLGLALKCLNYSDPVALLMMFFVFAAPVYTYYQAGMIPGISAFALSMAGLLSLACFRETIRTRHIYLGITFFTLAALIRLPFVMFLLSALLAVFFTHFRYREVRLHTTRAAIISLAVILAYYAYNQYLGNTYGSVFLQKPMPPENLADFTEIMRSSWSNWKWHYFTSGHYLIMLVALVLLLLQVFRKKLHNDIFFLTGVISLIPASLYVVVMAKQFVAHDYYLIDSLMIPLLLLTVSGLGNLPENVHKKPLIIWIVALLLIAFMLFRSFGVQKERYTTHNWDRIETTRINFTGSDKLLEKAGIPEDARILVLDAYTNNTALLLLKRKGYVVINTTRKNIEKGLSYNYDYIAVQNSFLSSDVLVPYPELRNRLKPIANNGRVGIYQYSKEMFELSFADMFGFDPDAALWSKSFDNDSIQDASAEFVPLALLVADTLTVKAEALLFGSTLIRQNLDSEAELLLVIDIQRGGKLLHYSSIALKPFLQDDCTSCVAEVYHPLPLKLETGDVFKCYLWNRNKQVFGLENFDIQLIKLNLP
jgi:hypothetical protein